MWRSASPARQLARAGGDDGQRALHGQRLLLPLSVRTRVPVLRRALRARHRGRDPEFDGRPHRGFIAEPIQGSAASSLRPRVLPPRLRDREEVRASPSPTRCRAAGADRTHMFSIQHWNVEPDIMVFAKGLANGLAAGAFIARSEIADAYKGPTSRRSVESIAMVGRWPTSTTSASTTCGQRRAHGEAAARRARRAREEAPVDRRGPRQRLMVGVELVRDRRRRTASPKRRAS